MENYTVTRRFRQKNGKLNAYTVRDISTDTEYTVTSDVLKREITTGKIHVKGATVTSDNRLIFSKDVLRNIQDVSAIPKWKSVGNYTVLTSYKAPKGKFKVCYEHKHVSLDTAVEDTIEYFHKLIRADFGGEAESRLKVDYCGTEYKSLDNSGQYAWCTEYSFMTKVLARCDNNGHWNDIRFKVVLMYS